MWALSTFAAQAICFMLDVHTRIRINRPLSEVARFATDPDNAPLWYKNIRTVEWISERPLRVGSLIRFTARFIGKEMSYVYEVKEFIPAQKLVMKSIEGPLDMTTEYTWKSISGGSTDMDLRNSGSGSKFPRMIIPLVSYLMKKANRKDLARLKAILETSG